MTAPADVVLRSANKVGFWFAWTCDHERLLRLATALERCVAVLRDRAAAGDPAFRDITDDDFGVRLEARHKDLGMKERGTPAAVLASLDPAGLESMVLTAGVLPRQVVAMSSELVELDLPPTLVQSRSGDTAFFTGVSFSKTRGLGLHVRGSDPQWVRSTYSELESEIKKALPWWRFLRSGHLWWLYAAFGTLMSMYGLAPTMHGRPVGWVAASVCAGAVLGASVLAAARRLLPGFEILTHGSNGKAARVLAVVGALAANVALGVIVNLATK